MSEPIPESIPTATSRLSGRPSKRARPSGAGISAQSHSLAVLFANADREITIPASSRDAAPQSKDAALAAAPEIVPNVQGSSAGAGSGEFHVYKASRRREYDRLKAMDAEVQREADEKAWEEKRVEGERKEEKRMNRNKGRRQKAKERAQAKKAGGLVATAADGDGEGNGTDEAGEDGGGDANEATAKGPLKAKKGGILGFRKGLWAGETGRDISAGNTHDEGDTPVEEVGLTIHDDED